MQLKISALALTAFLSWHRSFGINATTGAAHPNTASSRSIAQPSMTTLNPDRRKGPFLMDTFHPGQPIWVWPVDKGRWQEARCGNPMCQLLDEAWEVHAPNGTGTFQRDYMRASKPAPGDKPGQLINVRTMAQGALGRRSDFGGNAALACWFDLLAYNALPEYATVTAIRPNGSVVTLGSITWHRFADPIKRVW